MIWTTLLFVISAIIVISSATPEAANGRRREKLNFQIPISVLEEMNELKEQQLKGRMPLLPSQANSLGQQSLVGKMPGSYGNWPFSGNGIRYQQRRPLTDGKIAQLSYLISQG